MEFIKEFFEFLKERKKLVLIPVLLVVLLIGGIVGAAQGTAISPFIYALF